MMAEPSKDEIRIRDIFMFLYAQKIYILCFTLSFAVLGFINTSPPQVKYKAETVVELAVAKDAQLMYRDELVLGFMKILKKRYKRQYQNIFFEGRKGVSFSVILLGEKRENVRNTLENFILIWINSMTKLNKST